MSKKGGDLEELAQEFLELIFKELDYDVVRSRIQLSGSQDGYDNLIEITDNKYMSRLIYTECKDYTTVLNYTDAMTKLPQLASTHEKIDLALFISPRKKFSNIFEETRNRPFLESLADSQFRVAFLTPETYVQKYFTLYPEIYKRAYGTEAPVLANGDREEILKQFDRYMFSDKNLRKIVIDEADRQDYIGTIGSDVHHIKRTLRVEQKRENEFYTPVSKQRTLVSEINSSSSGIVLLGNPGFGKTSEMRQAAATLWNERESTHAVPFFRSLKNFTVSSSIEDFLPKNFRSFPRLAVIFDGVDEIENIIDFSSKLRNFIENYKRPAVGEGLKFIISCRTSIYKKYIIDIDGLEVFYLNEVSIYSGMHFLKNKYGLDLYAHKTFDSYKNREILENPFYLDLLGQYYKIHNRLLASKAILIRDFVDTRLEDDRINKFRNDAGFDRETIISYTQKIAFALEAMQKSFLPSSDVRKIAGSDDKSLAKNSFLEENMAGNWSFALKNIQEYFVANTLCNLEFEAISKIIAIDEKTQRVHPTWHNVVTFLLCLIPENETYEQLINWLLENDSDLLFNADTDRISEDIKARVLQDYFYKNCIEDNLWVDDLKSIASFGQCETNIEYLLKNARDTNLHKRARLSALKLLSCTEIPIQYSREVEDAVLSIALESTTDGFSYIVEDAIHLAKSMELNEDPVFFNKVLVLLKNHDEREIVRALISATPVASSVQMLDYFLELLDKATGIGNWNSQSEYGSVISTEDNIFSLLTKIEDGAALLKIFEYSIPRHGKHRFKDSLVKEFAGHLKQFFVLNKEFHPDLVRIISDAVVNDSEYRYDEDLLLDIAASCGIEGQLFERIFDSVGANSRDRHFLAALAVEADFEKVLQEYNAGGIDGEFLQGFRNVISCRSFEMSKRLESYIEAGSTYVFKEKRTKEEIDENTLYWKTKDQKEFDVLFDNKELVLQIHKLFDYLGKTKLNYKDIDKFYHKYYRNFELQKNVTVTAKQLLYEILRDNYRGRKKLDKNEVMNELVRARTNIIQDILDRLPTEKNSRKIEITESQRQFVKDWCDENTGSVKQYCRDVLFKTGKKECESHYVFEAIYKFQEFFLFDMDQELLLDMLWFNSYEKGITTEYLEGVVPTELVSDRVRFNLSAVPLSPRNFCNHLKFCKEKSINIQDLGLDLKDKMYAFLSGGHYHYGGEIIENFFSHDIDALKGLLSHSFQNIAETRRFVIDKAVRYLDEEGRGEIAKDFLLSSRSRLVGDGVFDEKEIVRLLIGLNFEGAFSEYHDLIKKQIVSNKSGEFAFRKQEWLNFDHAEKLGDMASLLEMCLSTPDLEKIFGRYYSPLRICCETVISICKKNGESGCENALLILMKIDTDALKKQNADLFYLNRLKRDIQELLYRHMSKPYSLAQIVKILDENRHLFA